MRRNRWRSIDTCSTLGLYLVSKPGVIIVYLADSRSNVENGDEPASATGETHLTGLGIGLLSAAAIALARDVSEIPFYGAEAIAIAFRMGIHVQGVSHNLEARDLNEPPKTWAYVVHNVDPQETKRELEAFHESVPSPDTSRIFISAVSRTSVTISGPPSKLENLFKKATAFRDAKAIALPVYGGMCHAPHIYDSHDVEVIVQDVVAPSALLHPQEEPKLPLLSTSSGDPYTASNATELFKSVVNELLTKAIEWEKVIAQEIHYMKENKRTQVKLSCFGNSIPLNDLRSDLQKAIQDASISLNNFMSVLRKDATEASTPRGTAQSKLAIVGMSCRFPGGATDTEKFWEVLEAGLDVSRQIPSDRFDIKTHYDPEGKDLNKTMTQYGCFIDEPGMFDASFFNMSPREAMAVDPQMRLSLVTAYEALERAGYVANRTQSTKLQRIGTYYGQAADDYREVNQGQEVGTYYIPGGCRAFGPGRINYFFKFAGPSYSIDTACSSGLAAIEVSR